MKVAPKVIVLFTDPHGFGSAIFQALHPHPDFNVTREDSSLDLPVAEKYGIACEASASCELAQFLAPDGSAQVSMLLLPNFKPPIAICVIHELLRLITSDKQNELPTLIFPYYIEPQKITWERLPTSLDQEVLLYGAEIAAATESTKAILSGVPKPSPALRIPCEPLNCLVHLVQVFRLSAVLLVGTGTRHQNTSAADKELEALCELGGFLANFSGLVFAGDKISRKEKVESLVSQEPWQALYA